jgi:hypothetical protein
VTRKSLAFVVPDILAQQNSAPLQCSFAVTPLIALVGRVAFNQGGDGSIKVTAERSALYRVPVRNRAGLGLSRGTNGTGQR